MLKEESVGIGIDRDAMKLYRATETNLGQLENYDLMTGNVSTEKGV